VTTVAGSNFYMGDGHTTDDLYRVVRVQVIAWKN
jgi:hypothetical protein